MKRSREPEEEESQDEQDVASVPIPKIVNLDTNGPSTQATSTVIKCSLPGHASDLGFTGYSDYEKHYNNAHTNRCLDCWMNFPSAHILDLHIREHHDALTEIRREKGEKVYVCFVETCQDEFTSLKARKTHLLKTHMYPANYFFAVTKYGIDRRQSMLVEEHKGPGSWHARSRPQAQRPESDAKMSSLVHGDDNDVVASKDVSMGEDGTDVDAPERIPIRNNGDPTEAKQVIAIADAEMDDLASSMSSLKFVPRTLRLGPKKKAGAASR